MSRTQLIVNLYQWTNRDQYMERLEVPGDQERREAFMDKCLVAVALVLFAWVML